MARWGGLGGGWEWACFRPPRLIFLTPHLCPPTSTSGQAWLEELPWDPQGHDPLSAEGVRPAQRGGAGVAQGMRGVGLGLAGTVARTRWAPHRRSTSLGKPCRKLSLRTPSASTTRWPRGPVTIARGRTSSTCALLTGGSSSFRPRECPPLAHPRPLPHPQQTPLPCPRTASFLLGPHPEPALPSRDGSLAPVPGGRAVSPGAWSRCSPGSLASMWWLPCSPHPPSQLPSAPRRSSAALCYPALPPASPRYPPVPPVHLVPRGKWGAGVGPA